MATVLETPSRIWRRIEAIEHRDMPSLPSLPHFEDSEGEEGFSEEPAQAEDEEEEEEIESRSSVPDIYLPPEVDEEQQDSVPDFSLAHALESISREESPLLPDITQDGPPEDYVSLISEPKPSPLEKYRHVALRRTNPRARLPSLTRTSSSGSSSSSQATPRSSRSLSESHEASVAPVIDQEHVGEPEESTPQDHEPTFSSEGDPTPYAINNKVATGVVRSPSPSLAFTPTPALPRPRARFSLPTPPSDLLSTPAPGPRNGEDQDQTPRRDMIPATPYNRPSFLLSVINTTARPRLTAGTPHPKMFGTPSLAESTPAANNGSNGIYPSVTRRPRIGLAPRLSHPMSARPSSGSETASPVENPWGTYDGTTDKASFISTASSHDLTTNPRVNTSFDPAMGFGPGAPVGRFNANKLNTYLHGLNRRLQEENEALVERLKELEAEKQAWTTSTSEAENSGKRPSRRRSSIGTVLGDVEEDKAEEWWEEKAELEGMVEMLKTEAEVYETRQRELEKQLEKEIEEREGDKILWREMMMEAQEDREMAAERAAEEYKELEHALDEANKEKANLRALLDQSMLKMTTNEIGTPNKLTSGISPIHRHVLNMSIRMPKTPGTPLRDLSWLNTMQHDSSMTPLVTELRRLQGDLDRANESIDDKLDKLENAGLDIVSLTQKLDDARTRIIPLEDEIADLRRKEDRRTRRLARARCQKCHIKLDLEYIIQPDEDSINVTKDSLPTEPPTPPTKTSEALKANLHAVNDHLDELKKQWETEKSRLLEEKAILQDAANRLNTEIRNTKSEAKMASEGTRMVAAAKANVQTELGKAKETIAVLEKELSSERSRLRSMVAEQERMQHEKKRILTDMQRNESDMEEVKQQMDKLKKENQKLEKELRENATVEQKARLLETRVIENVDTIDQLRQERSTLVNEHKDLQRRFKDISDVANNLRNKCTSLSTAHDNRRHELDMHRLEIDELRKALEDRASDLQRMEREKKASSSEKENVARTVASLEADLRRVKSDAEAFGRDLNALRAEKENLEARSKDGIAKSERAKKQAHAQIRILTEQLNAEKDRASKVIEQLESRKSVIDDDQLSKLKIQHNKECKGLIVQICYLKAKFTRESLFREDLTYQKHYLLVLLQQFEMSERNIFAAIARIGFPVHPTVQQRKPKLKSAVHALIFLSRMKKASCAWNQESASKKLVVAAFQDVGKRRAANSD